MRDRDYSMMVTKSPEWLKTRTMSVHGYSKVGRQNVRKCKIIDIETGESKIYPSCRESDRQNGFKIGHTTMAIRSRAMIKKRYLATYEI